MLLIKKINLKLFWLRFYRFFKLYIYIFDISMQFRIQFFHRKPPEEKWFSVQTQDTLFNNKLSLKYRNFTIMAPRWFGGKKKLFPRDKTENRGMDYIYSFKNTTPSVHNYYFIKNLLHTRIKINTFEFYLQKQKYSHSPWQKFLFASEPYKWNVPD